MQPLWKRQRIIRGSNLTQVSQCGTNDGSHKMKWMSTDVCSRTNTLCHYFIFRTMILYTQREGWVLEWPNNDDGWIKFDQSHVFQKWTGLEESTNLSYAWEWEGILVLEINLLAHFRVPISRVCIEEINLLLIYYYMLLHIKETFASSFLAICTYQDLINVQKWLKLPWPYLNTKYIR